MQDHHKSFLIKDLLGDVLTESSEGNKFPRLTIIKYFTENLICVHNSVEFCI